MLNKRLEELRQKEDPPFVFAYAAYTPFIGPKDVFLNLAMSANNKTLTALQSLMEENERVKKYGFTESEFEREKKSY